MITAEGLNLILDIVFVDEPKPSAFYVGLINATGYTGVSALDTMASHLGWTELTAYDESTRPQVTFGNPSGGTVTNPAIVQFTPNASSTCVGYFITTNATKGGTSGYLIAIGSFAEGTQSLVSGVAESFTANISGSSN